MVVAILSFVTVVTFSALLILSKYWRFDRFTILINVVIILGCTCGLVATMIIEILHEGNEIGVGSAMLYAASVLYTLVFDILMFRNLAISE